MVDLNTSLRIQTDIKDRYLLLARLGSGGMADVFLGIQRGAAGFEQLVVVKRIKAGRLSQADDSVRMFVREARTVAQLNHPHVVKVFDLCRMGDAVAIVMEYLDGENLEYVARALGRARRRIPLAVLARLLIQACEALHYAHTAKNAEGQPLNLVHRDVGPHNLMLDSSGYLKVIDFGIAKTAAVQMDLTSPGVIKGKLSYLAPDCFKFSEIDHRVDVYAMGLVLWRMLTLRVPFDFKPDVTIGEVIHRISSEKLISPSQLEPDLPQEIDDIVAAATHPDREQRIQTCEALASRLAACAEKHGGLAPAPDARRWFQETFKLRIQKRREFEKTLLAQARQAAERPPPLAPAPGKTGETTLPQVNLPSLPGTAAISPTPSSQIPVAPAAGAPRRSRRWLWLAPLLLALAGGSFAAVKIFVLDRQTSVPGAPPTHPPTPAASNNLVIVARPFPANVFIDGTPAGVASEQGFATRIPPNSTHAIEVRKEGYVSFAAQATGQETGVLRLEANLVAVPQPMAVVAPAPAPVAPSPAPAPPSEPPTRDRHRRPPRPVAAAHSPTEPPKPVKPESPEPTPTPAPPAQPPPAPTPFASGEPPPPKPTPLPPEPPPPTPRLAAAEPAPPPPPPRPEPTPKIQYLSGSGTWDGEQVLSRGCGSCHGVRASAIQYEKKTRSQWEFFFQRRRHSRTAELDKLFSPDELKRALESILRRIEKKQKSGIAGER